MVDLEICHSLHRVVQMVCVCCLSSIQTYVKRSFYLRIETNMNGLPCCCPKGVFGLGS
jgi:hypothetical protein